MTKAIVVAYRPEHVIRAEREAAERKARAEREARAQRAIFRMAVGLSGARLPECSAARLARLAREAERRAAERAERRNALRIFGGWICEEGR